MQLYSITYVQLTLISIFDEKGQKTGEREERVRVSMHDLPLPTAQMYRRKMTGLNFVMTEQIPGRDEPTSYRKRERREDPRAHSARAAARPAPPSKQQQINQAAATGDMTGAINMGGK